MMVCSFKKNHIPISSHKLGLATAASWPDLQAEPEMEVVQFHEGKSYLLLRRGVCTFFSLIE